MWPVSNFRLYFGLGDARGRLGEGEFCISISPKIIEENAILSTNMESELSNSESENDPPQDDPRPFDFRPKFVLANPNEHLDEFTVIL